MNEQLLSNIPHEKYMDLAIVAYCKIDNCKFADASILIKNEHLERWGITESELFEAAKNNTRHKMRYIIQNISAILGDVIGTANDGEEEYSKILELKAL